MNIIQYSLEHLGPSLKNDDARVVISRHRQTPALIMQISLSPLSLASLFAKVNREVIAPFKISLTTVERQRLSRGGTQPEGEKGEER